MKKSYDGQGVWHTPWWSKVHRNMAVAAIEIGSYYKALPWVLQQQQEQQEEQQQAEQAQEDAQQQQQQQDDADGQDAGDQPDEAAPEPEPDPGE